MKPYAVCAFKAESLSDFRIDRLERFAWIQRTENTDGQHWTDEDFVLFWCDTIGDAESLAKSLANKHSGIEYCVMNLSYVYQSKPGPVKGSKMTEEGLMPL